MCFYFQGSNQAMPWLADLVESSEGSFNVLPVQCLCEFLLNSTTNAISAANDGAEGASGNSEENLKMKKRKQKQLLIHLQNLLQHPVSEEQQRSCIETLDYFMSRLSSQQTNQRVQVRFHDKFILFDYLLRQFAILYLCPWSRPLAACFENTFWHPRFCKRSNTYLLHTISFRYGQKRKKFNAFINSRPGQKVLQPRGGAHVAIQYSIANRQHTKEKFCLSHPYVLRL